jgi:hypothetical protein
MCWMPGFDPCKGEIFPFMTIVLLNKNFSRVGKQSDSKALHLPSHNTSSGHNFHQCTTSVLNTSKHSKRESSPSKMLYRQLGGIDVWLFLLTSVPVSVQRHALGTLFPEKSFGTHFTGGWVGLRADLWIGENPLPSPGFFRILQMFKMYLYDVARYQCSYVSDIEHEGQWFTTFFHLAACFHKLYPSY